MTEKLSVNRYINKELIGKFWPLAVFFLVVYIPISFFVLHDTIAGWFHLADLLLILATMFYYRKTGNLQVACNALVFMGTPILFPWLLSGGPMQTGLWWSSIYVVWAFFLTSKRWAIFWLSLYVTVCIVTVILSQLGLFTIGYSLPELANLLFAFLFLSVLVYFFNEANEYYFNISNKELAERKKAEEKFRILLESTPDALIIADSSGTISMINHEAEKLFGYTKQEVSSKKIEALVPAGFNPTQNGNREIKAIKKDGTEFPAEISVSPLQNEGLLLGAIRDITIKKEQEEKLRKYSILEAKSKEMEQFTYIASHDLRHPLLTILNYIKVLQAEYAAKLDDDGKMFIELIAESADRMDKLVLGLLDYSRLSKIKELETVNCNEIVHAVLADLSSAIQQSKAHITIDPLPTISGYPLELRQLFQNLIANAIKFRKKDTPPVIHVRAQFDSGGYMFEVSDNGIGIAEKDLDKIFQIFQRLHSADEYEGLGLGLAYCKKIVELHNGQIWVKSTPGKGSSFYFSIKT